jgi:hypothetical protein
MPDVVLIAKSVFVWLAHLSSDYGRPIERLDEVPDEALDSLQARGFTALWLIGIFERSEASRRIKQRIGDRDALASAYSLKTYEIASALGGKSAYESLARRAAARGIRMAADMVPNHVGLDGDWVVEHPEWFLQTDVPPFPAYRFGGPDLSSRPEVSIFVEEGYWSKSDAAVVFRLLDHRTGKQRFIYHGNDGTSTPWNDTAQLDYTNADVRRAVIDLILGVAREFPILRFDAAMTLAKRHYARLWFPQPGETSAIASRSDYAMTPAEFDEVFPVEFWREVVDAVARHAPHTLLLAEAFWMMEGYFVRTLGMHRVYNSAFMNMLRREENQKYRETIKNVLDFEPKILERFVNFMNNPDEEPAIVQFGSGDKYFGVCVLMCTMPGLPMFGHGQFEGFHEKYGMEYQRPKWNEPTNAELLLRHEREIVPLLKRRHLFGGVENFCFYDFYGEGAVDEDVFAYSNGTASTFALIVYNNKFKKAFGRLRKSIPTRNEGGNISTRTILESLGVSGESGQWLVFRDALKGYEYLRDASSGIAFSLNAYECHVFGEFRLVAESEERCCRELYSHIGERGVPSVDEALMEVRFRPVEQALIAAFSAAVAALETPGTDFASQLAVLAGACARLHSSASDSLECTRGRIERIVRMVTDPAAARERYSEGGVAREDAPPLLAWALSSGVVAELGYESRRDVLRTVRQFPGLGASSHDAELVDVLVSLSERSLHEAMLDALRLSSGRDYLGVNTANGVEWFNAEAFTELARILGQCAVIDGRASAAMMARTVDDLATLAARAGYRVDAFVTR